MMASIDIERNNTTEEENCIDTDSDFDDEEDPDKIEVPGGGRDLQTAVSYANNKQKVETISNTNGNSNCNNAFSKSNNDVNFATKPSQISNQRLNSAMPKKSAVSTNPSSIGAGVSGSTTAYNNTAITTTNGSVGGVSEITSTLNNQAKINELVMQKIQALVAANPELLIHGIPNQLLSQILMQTIKPTPPQPAVVLSPEEDEGEFEEMGVAETYAEYWPAKLKLGCKHPDAVVETASLSSVEPCDVYYELSIPRNIIESGQLSALQLESITYASQAHGHFLPDGSRAGFLIGDGAGVGKGRTIAGIIYENYLKGRKRAIWVSVSNDLKYDAERDLTDIGAGKIEVHALSKFKYAKLSSDVNNCKKGVIFSTYPALIGESTSNKNGKFNSRLKQLIDWCGENFDGVIVFDECHKAKNLCPVSSSKSTKTGQTVLELQQLLPQARVVYASATGASEPKHMAYMVRLGLWGSGTAFQNFNDFISAVEKRGVGAMEIVAMDMKLRGMYIARQLSFHGVSFRIDEVPLSKEFCKIYDEAVELWVIAMQRFTEAAELIDAESRMKKTMWGQFWSSHQRFFKYMCIAAKVEYAVRVAREALSNGKCVVIGLQSTGEARTLEQLDKDDGELTDFISTAKGVFQSLVEKHFPAPDRDRIRRILGLNDESDGRKTVLRSLLAGFTRKEEVAAGNYNNAQNLKGEKCSVTSGKKERRKNQKEIEYNNHNNEEDDENCDEEEEENEDEDDDDEDEEDDDGEFDESGGESSDFNPFGVSGSDSETDPWVARTKRKRKKLSFDEDENDDKSTGRSKRKKKKKQRVKELEQQETNRLIASTLGFNNKFNHYNTKNNTNTEAQNSSTNRERVTAATTTVISSSTTPTKSNQDRIQEMFRRKYELQQTTTNVTSSSALLNSRASYGPPSKDAIEKACSMKEELLRRIESLGERLPPNTLDQLIDELGGPENVAEMTGRKGRVVQSNNGAIQYETRSEHDVPLETLNITEKQRFMNGEKKVAIISEAASSGISLQSDRRVRNQRRRVHITLELPWSADRAIQQFGRTHRSNQVNAPEYIFLISNLAGERRFASTVAKRLESLGALTHGDRRATESRDLSQFNIENKYGRNALESVMKTIMGYEQPLVKPPLDYRGDFFKDIADALVGVGLIVNSETNPGVLSLDKDYNNISKFLNRILGMPVDLQNRVFKYFNDTLTTIINRERKVGRFDLGILDLGAGGQNVMRVKLIRFLRRHATGRAPTELHTVRVERGMIWQEAIEKYADLLHDYEGFYLSNMVRNGRRTAILAVENEQTSSTAGVSMNHSNEQRGSKPKRSIPMMHIYRPNTGQQLRCEALNEIEKRYVKVSKEEAEKHWILQYDLSANTCSHVFWNGICRTVNANMECEVGLRQRSYHILAGSVLSVWGRVEQVLTSRNVNNKMQVIRLKTREGEKIVGTLIPKSCHELLIQTLSADAERVEEIPF